jgi:Skp family chaperone for outer membrane proteins
VKRMTWMVAALAAVATLCLAGQARAQGTGTRVAVVNIGTVFSKYEKATAFKKEMEDVLKPFKDQAEKIKKNMLDYETAAKNPAVPEKDREQYVSYLRTLKRQLEDLDLEARKKIGKRQEDHLVQLYREVSGQIQAVASSNGFHLVLGYGEPPNEDLMSFMNINRKLTGMDMGSTVPLFINPNLDISEQVVTSLNQAYRSTGATPTGQNK